MSLSPDLNEGVGELVVRLQTRLLTVVALAFQPLLWFLGWCECVRVLVPLVQCAMGQVHPETGVTCTLHGGTLADLGSNMLLVFGCHLWTSEAGGLLRGC